MGLLASYRRFWIAVVFAVLCLPMLGHVLQPAIPPEAERGTLRELPAFPQTSIQWLRLPRALDGYLADRFGFRADLIRANAQLRYQIASSTHEHVIFGRDGWLFNTANSAIEQSAGLLLRADRIETHANSIALLHRRLADKNIKFVFGLPPNNSTISYAHLPAWVGAAPRRTEYDLMMDALRSRGVPTADLRAAIRAFGPAHLTYHRRDTHWNRLGALVAYNEFVRALDLSDWSIDIALVFKGFERVVGRDIARLLGLGAVLDDVDAVIDLSRAGPDTGAIPQVAPGDYTLETGHPGPSVLVIGDSFTAGYFRRYLWLHAGRLIWMTERGCGLKPDEVEAHKPDIVIYTPTERFVGCG